MSSIEFKLETPAGTVSAILDCPVNASHALVLAHGAGANCRHAHMIALATAFKNVGMATLRFNFPFMEQGKRRVDSHDVATDCITIAAEELRSRVDLPLLIGGHSFGGRMATHAVAAQKADCAAMILCSFPLHPANKPGVERAAHLGGVAVPMLFLSGTRDALSEQGLLESVVAPLPGHHQLHWLDTADHSFRILKRQRSSTADVYAEVSEATSSFISGLRKNQRTLKH